MKPEDAALVERAAALAALLSEDGETEVTGLDILDNLATLGFDLIPSVDNSARDAYYAALDAR
jgi:hypothetical protein